MRKTLMMVFVVCALLVSAAAVYADDRPHEGKVVSIDKDTMTVVVQGDKNDKWTLYYTEATKLKNELIVEELKVGDAVHFDYSEKDGKMWLTELKRTDRAKG